MPINKEALNQLKSADKLCAQSFVDTMEHMFNIKNAMGAPGDAQITLDYQGSDMEVKNGEMIPFITIGLRQAIVVEEG